MITDIVAGVSSSIYGEFGSGYKIYTEKVEQGLQEPCFFIKVLSSSMQRVLHERYQLIVQLDVHYFPNGGGVADMQSKALALHSVLRCLQLLNGDKLNAFNVSWECVDGVLHFNVSYKPFVLYAVAGTDELMGSVSVDEYVR